VQWDASAKFLRPLDETIPLTTHVKRANAVLEHRFTFLNQTVVYHDRVLWHDRSQQRLWRFHLHYFDAAVDLGRAFQTTENPQYWSTFMRLTSDWMDNNPPRQGDGWHPYTISLRLVNWIRAFFLFEQCFTAEPSFRNRFLASLHRQVHALRRNVEYDVTGNHLIKNGKALVFAGAFVQGEEAARWFHQGLRLLVEQAAEQVLTDGGHYERSPLYHVQVLMDYLDVLVLLPVECEERAQLVVVVQRMMDFLRDILHPDRTLPLFNDCVLMTEPTPEVILRYGRAVTATSATISGVSPDTQSFVDSGYYVFRAADHFLILDCGPVCPDHLPPHAHCDLLSFELSIGQQRIMTNSGTYVYEAGPWRDAFRGTAAHNTVQVDDEEQSAIWSSFRVGRRARVWDVEVRQLAPGVYFRGAYRGFGGNRMAHWRELFLLPGPCWIIMDTLGRHRGSESLVATSAVHFYPGVEVAMQAPEVHVRRGDVQLKLLSMDGTPFTLDEAWFSPELGRKERNPVLRCRVQGRLPLCWGLVIAGGHLTVEVQCFTRTPGGWSAQVLCGDRHYRLCGPSGHAERHSSLPLEIAP
jgi:hypothetical protein